MKKNFPFILWLVLAAVSFLYGVVISGASSGTDFYVIWHILGIIFVLFAVCAKLHLWGRLKKQVKIIFFALLGICVTLVLAFEVCLFSKFNETAPDGLDYLLVLGAQVYEDRPSVVLKYRLDAAIAYLEKNPDTLVIVSGGKGSYEPFSEAEGMADYLIKNGIDKDRIILENQSMTTLQNIRFSKEYIEEGKTVGIVTNNFHMFRALQIAHEQGLSQAVGLSAPSTIVYLPNNCFREFFGEVKYQFLKNS